MADTQILRAGGPAPFDYIIPANAELIAKVVSAQVDGSGAAGAFEPTVIIESDAGEIVAECPAPQMAAGESRRVSWFPEGDVATSSGGIQYDVVNSGDWLTVEVTSGGGPSGQGIYFKSVNTNGMVFEVGDNGAGSPDVKYSISDSGFEFECFTPNNDAIDWQIGPDSINLLSTMVNPLLIENDGTGGVQLHSAGGQVRINNSNVGTKLSFFGVAAVAQQATPVTLADVIALLRAYGLAA